jgi:hypothetical protein
VGTLLLVALIAGMLGRNVYRLTEIERRINAQGDTLHELERQKLALNDVVHTLTDAPDGGVRAAKHRVENISSEQYDFFLWIDASRRSAVPIREVHYLFHGWADSLRRSADQRTGFAVFQRASPPRCPDSTTVIITLADDTDITHLLDLCQAAAIGSRQASAK